jgi:hypothetical protein
MFVKFAYQLSLFISKYLRMELAKIINPFTEVILNWLVSSYFPLMFNFKINKTVTIYDKSKFDKCCKTPGLIHQIIGEYRNFAVIPTASKGEPQFNDYE